MIRSRSVVIEWNNQVVFFDKRPFKSHTRAAKKSDLGRISFNFRSKKGTNCSFEIVFHARWANSSRKYVYENKDERVGNYKKYECLKDFCQSILDSRWIRNVYNNR